MNDLMDSDRRALERRIHEALTRLDFIAIGNLVLETLVRMNPEGSAGKRGEFLHGMMARVIEKRFSLPFETTYAMPLRDEHIEYHRRNSWEADIFPQLVTFAFVLGATIRDLPPPLRDLVPFYLLMAEKQRKCIEEAAKACASAPKPTIGAMTIREILNSDLSAEEKEMEILRLANGTAAAKPSRKIAPD